VPLFLTLIAAGDCAQMSRPTKDDGNGNKRRSREEALDEALKDTFPASDPVSVEQPTLAAVTCERDELQSAGPHARSDLMDPNKTPERGGPSAYRLQRSRRQYATDGGKRQERNLARRLN
jgi:hypothetical protein